jgi:hypothetical protein
VVLGGLLEPQSEDVQPNQRSGTNFHLGKGLQHKGQGQMGFSYITLSSGGLGIIDPEAQLEALRARGGEP